MVSELPEPTGRGTADAQTRTPGALGLAVLGRSDEVARTVIQRWELGRGTYLEDDTVLRQDVYRFSEDGTKQVCNFLISGEVLEDLGGSASSAGWHIANRSSTFADVVKIFLYWRDSLTMVLREEARRLGTDPGALLMAERAAHAGADISLVEVARRCDEYRGLLQSQLEEEQGRLTHQALHDALTGLPNRVLFLERLAQSVEAATRRSIHSSVLFV